MKLRRRPQELHLDLTPLIDVVFLLLTFFIFAVFVMVRAEVLDVSLPALGAAKKAEPGLAITVAVRQDGSLAVDGEAVAAEALVETLLAKREASPQARLLLALDENGRTGDVLGVTDKLIAAGITDFSLLATPSPAGAGPADPAASGSGPVESGPIESGP